MGRYYEVEVVDTEMLTPYARRIDIRRSDGEPFGFRAGQFLMMHFEHEGKRLNRSYSMANPLPPGETCETLELCIALVDGGLGSAIVREWAPGSTFTVSGPHGRFVLREKETQNLVLVGTGTGIAPYRSMIPQITSAIAAGRTVDLLFGARDTDQFLYDDEWRELAASFDRFTYWPCASDPSDPAAWRTRGGTVGRVQVALEELEYETDETLFYLCGNEHMVDDVKQRLGDADVPRRHIRTEAYVSPEAVSY
jgi:ferredoxin-NADP reductase